MADAEVSALTAVTLADVTSTDILYFVDLGELVAADRSKYITMDMLFDYSYLNAYAAATPAVGDFLVFSDVNDSNLQKKVTVANFLAIDIPPTTVSAATHSLAAGERTLHVTRTLTGVCAVTVTTAEIAKAGRMITIKDAGLNCSTYNITISTEGAETIDGDSTLILSSDGASAELYSDGSNLFIK